MAEAVVGLLRGAGASHMQRHTADAAILKIFAQKLFFRLKKIASCKLFLCKCLNLKISSF